MYGIKGQKQPSEFAKGIGERLRILRKSKGLSQAKLASLLHIAQSSINRYESGLTSVPLEVLDSYHKYFNVTMDYIFGYVDNPRGALFPQQKSEEKIRADQLEHLIKEYFFKPESFFYQRLIPIILDIGKEERNS